MYLQIYCTFLLNTPIATIIRGFDAALHALASKALPRRWCRLRGRCEGETDIDGGLEVPKLSNVLIPAICTAIVSTSTTAAIAHQQWVLPNFFVTDTKDDTVWLGFEHALGDQRFVASLGPGPALLWVTGPGDEVSSPSFAYTGKTRTVAEIELKKPGTYRVTTEEPESHWTKLAEGNEPRWVRMSRDRVVGKKIEVSKRFWSKSITYVTFRDRTSGPLAAQGDPVELVPIDHPNAIVAGKPFRLRVLADGAPLANAEIKVYGDASRGHDASMTVKSDAQGRAQLRFAKVGRYLMSARHEVAAKDDPKADAYAYSVNVMVEARAAQ